MPLQPLPAADITLDLTSLKPIRGHTFKFFDCSSAPLTVTIDVMVAKNFQPPSYTMTPRDLHFPVDAGSGTALPDGGKKYRFNLVLPSPQPEGSTSYTFEFNSQPAIASLGRPVPDDSPRVSSGTIEVSGGPMEDGA
ncbi:hypothetical protein HI113_24205 [Corallococcus exiguus]|uniref:hypothetical protein n=1 Tax=Corallococcus exiguus TaxID=83462 RepID=UPI001475BA77|nr:hypothetical protein [Corallococcus exiguus]NNB97010.1 hypothetical protein [Corallococcus exiguus]